MTTLLVFGQIIFGGYFVYSGYKHFKNLTMLSGYAGSKGVPMPTTAVFITGSMMVIGGLGIIFRMYTHFSLALIAIFLIGVTFQMHQYWKIKDPMQKMGEQVNFNKNIALLGAVLMLYVLF